MTDQVLQRLSEVIRQRRDASPDDSYVARLNEQGLDAILKKIGEESAELILAAKGEGKEAIIHETADLFFHVLVLLVRNELGPEDICTELDKRFGKSGLEEKAQRNSQQ